MESARDLGLTEDDLDALHSVMGKVLPVPRERMAVVLTELLERKAITLTATAKELIVVFAETEGKLSVAYKVER